MCTLRTCWGFHQHYYLLWPGENLLCEMPLDHLHNCIVHGKSQRNTQVGPKFCIPSATTAVIWYIRITAPCWDLPLVQKRFRAILCEEVAVIGITESSSSTSKSPKEQATTWTATTEGSKTSRLFSCANQHSFRPSEEDEVSGQKMLYTLHNCIFYCFTSCIISCSLASYQS